MDRLQYRFEPCHQAPPRPTFQLASDLVTPPLADSSRALFAPLHYESNYAYPLIVWLHSPGRDEHELMRIMPRISLRNFVAVAPRGFRLPADELGREPLGWPQTEEHIEAAEQRVFDAVEEACQKFNVAPDRMFLAGFGSGGTMAFRVGMDHPDRFAGVLSLCGRFPRGHHPFGRLAQARKLPIFLSLGRDSEDYNQAAACEDLRLLHTAGMSVALRQYPCEHELSEQMLRDVDHWIIEQITAPCDSEDVLE